MKISGIYKIVNKIDEKYYVGSTNNFHKRWNFGHKQPLMENRHDNSKLQNAWNKHGQNNFECSLVEPVEQDKLLLVE
jgi:group I intron endonuclease